jgi:hypothetical protein
LGFFFLEAKLLGPTAASVIRFVLLQEVRSVLVTRQEALLINRRLGRYLEASSLDSASSFLSGISSSSPSPMDKNEKGHTVYFKRIADPTVIEKEK